MKLNHIFNQYKIDIERHQQDIDNIKTLIKNYKKKIKDDIIIFLTQNLCQKIHTAELLGYINYTQVLEVFEKVHQVREITDSEITYDFLCILERNYYKKYASIDFVENIFHSLSLIKKFQIATFCTGTSSLYEQFSYMASFLESEFNIHTNYSNEANYLMFTGYNSETSSANIMLYTTKNSILNSEKITKNIIKLYENGYANNIQIMEHTLSQYGSYSIKFNLENDSPQIIQCAYSTFNIIFESAKENIVDKWAECLDYISTHHWYQQNQVEVNHEHSCLQNNI